MLAVQKSQKGQKPKLLKYITKEISNKTTEGSDKKAWKGTNLLATVQRCSSRSEMTAKDDEEDDLSASRFETEETSNLS